MRRMFVHLLDTILGSRFWALLGKEVAQMLRNPELLRIILVPPTVMLVLFGFAMNPELENLKVGITDYSNSRASREFIEVFKQTNAFVVSQYYADQDAMTDALAKGSLTVGITIPPEFDDDIARNHTADVQVLYDAVDANTAQIASAYINQLVSDYNSRQLYSRSSTTSVELQRYSVQAQITVFYNPGLKSSWFFVPGMIGVLLTLIGSQTASSLLVREKEVGTIEQLMMTPVSNTEVILAKVCPLLVLLTFDASIALLTGRLVFNLPIRGSLLVFFSIGILYFWVGISIGILLACYTKSEQQAQLTAFFLNPPLVLLSGAISAISNMPRFMQWLSYLDPTRYFVEVCRGVLLKGVGFETLWPQVLALLSFATVLMILSIRQFQRQLS